MIDVNYFKQYSFLSPLDTGVSLEDIGASGYVYEAVADYASLPDPELASTGLVYVQADHAVYEVQGGEWKAFMVFAENVGAAITTNLSDNATLHIVDSIETLVRSGIVYVWDSSNSEWDIPQPSPPVVDYIWGDVADFASLPGAARDGHRCSITALGAQFEYDVSWYLVSQDARGLADADIILPSDIDIKHGAVLELDAGVRFWNSAWQKWVPFELKDVSLVNEYTIAGSENSAALTSGGWTTVSIAGAGAITTDGTRTCLSAPSAGASVDIARTPALTTSSAFYLSGYFTRTVTNTGSYVNYIYWRDGTNRYLISLCHASGLNIYRGDATSAPLAQLGTYNTSPQTCTSETFIEVWFKNGIVTMAINRGPAYSVTAQNALTSGSAATLGLYVARTASTADNKMFVRNFSFIVGS